MLLIALTLAAATARGQMIAATARGVLVAHDGRVELFNDDGSRRLWSADGVANATAIVTSPNRAAVLDALANEALLVDLADGRVTRVRTGETPIAGVFLGGDFYLLARDARTLERVTRDGARASLATAADPAFVVAANGRLYVYARTAGELEEITTTPFAVRRRVSVPPFASDVEADGRQLDLVQPRAAKVTTVSLETLTWSSQDVGAVPVDLAFTSSATALTARNLAVADPSAKRLWIVEGVQSFSQAVARGFLRGLLGLGLFAARNSDFPTGVDRVIARGGRWIAYDSSSGSLYRVQGSKGTLLVKDIAPNQFAVTPSGVVVWNAAVRRLQKIAD